MMTKKQESIDSFYQFSQQGTLPQWPLEIFLEISNVCDLKCAMCSVFSELNENRFINLKQESRGFFEPKQAALDELLQHALLVHCFGYGEPTVHPQFQEILKDVSQYDVMIDFFTNGMHLTEELCEFLVLNKVFRIYVSFSGATQSTYENVYLGGDFEQVLSGLARLNRIKAKYQSAYPQIEINSIAFQHHIDSIVEFVDLMADHGVNMISIKPLTLHDDLPQLHQHFAVMRPWVEGKLLAQAKQRAVERGMIYFNDHPYTSTCSVTSQAEADEFVQQRFNVTQDAPMVAIDQLKQVSKTIKPIRPEPQQKVKQSDQLDIQSPEIVPNPPCFEPFKTFYIKKNGQVRPCCFGDEDTTLGDINLNTGLEVWRGEGFQSIQQGILQGRYPRKICQSCMQYKNYPPDHGVNSLIDMYRGWQAQQTLTSLPIANNQQIIEDIQIWQREQPLYTKIEQQDQMLRHYIGEHKQFEYEQARHQFEMAYQQQRYESLNQTWTWLKPWKSVKRLSFEGDWQADPTYATWIQQSEKFVSTQLANPIPVSLILVVMDDNPQQIQQSIDSVRHQTDPFWQLVVLCTPQISLKWLKRDRRIQVITATIENKAQGYQQAMAYCQHNLMGCLQVADCLSPYALDKVAQAWDQNPELKCVYSDEDRIDLDRKRSNHCFKPDLNLDLLYSSNMIGDLVIYQRDLLQAVGGFRDQFAEAFLYDLMLRVVAHLDGQHIQHITAVLYHRHHDLSPTWRDSAMQALQSHLSDDTRVLDIKPHHALAHAFWVDYQLPEILPLVSIIMPMRNQWRVSQCCINSLLTGTDYKNWELIVVDNESDDPQTLTYLQNIAQHPQIQVIKDPQVFNYSAINNQAVQQAQGDVIILLNNDTEIITNSWLTELVKHALRPEIGAVGANLWHKDFTSQHAGVVLGIGELGIAGHAMKHLAKNQSGYQGRAWLRQNYSAVTAACMAIRRTTFLEISGFDEQLTVAFNDVDLCLRLQQQGYRNLWLPEVELFHHESISRGLDSNPEQQQRLLDEVAYMQEKWGDKLQSDPAYNKNLTHRYENFSLNLDITGINE